MKIINPHIQEPDKTQHKKHEENYTWSQINQKT
jgi:hypothetical protein